MTLMSISAFARSHGVSRAAVKKWQKAGFLRMSGDQVIVEESDGLLKAGSRGRFAQDADAAAPAPAEVTGVTGGAALGLHPPVTSLPDEITAEDAASLRQFLDRLLRGEFSTFAQAQAIKENALAGIRALEFMTKSGALIDLAEAEAIFFTTARAERDHWRAWPAKVAEKIASIIGVEAEPLKRALTEFVTAELAERSDPEFISEDGGEDVDA